MIDQKKSNETRKFDLEERLIDFAVLIINISDEMIDRCVGNHIARQIVLSGTHPALQYGEAQSGESRADVIHKLKVLLKELRETNNVLKIIRKSISTAQENLRLELNKRRDRKKENSDV